jgi:hypothetical protein
VLHEPEQRRVLADQQRDERAGDYPDARERHCLVDQFADERGRTSDWHEQEHAQPRHGNEGREEQRTDRPDARVELALVLLKVHTAADQQS